MGIIIDPSEGEADWRSAIKPAIQAISKAVGQKYVEAGFELHDAIKALRGKNETEGQQAWTLWRESLALSFSEFFKTAGLTRQPADRGELERLLAMILDESASLVKTENVELTAPDLKRPTTFRLYRAVRESIPAWARAVAPEHLRDDAHLRRRLDRAFVKGFHRARFDGEKHFTPLIRYLTDESAELVGRWDEWLHYYEWLRAEVEDEPLFGQKDSGPRLDDIFVKLRCTWKEPQKQRNCEDEEKEGTTVHVRWLSETLDEWLEAADRGDTLRVVTGGPGCGKSSSAKMFARDVARSDHYNVFVVPLQGMDVRAGIEDIVTGYVGIAAHGGQCLPESPIGWLREDPKPLLLVFDGLDEVARPDGAGFDVTRQFLGNLRNWLSTINGAATDAKVMALALGRPQAAAESAKDIALADPCILQVAPLCPLDRERLAQHYGENVNVLDPGNLGERDQRRQFWDQYTTFDPACASDEPEALRDKGFQDLTIEPLLLYLLMYSGYAGKDWSKASDNRNRVYQSIFERVHRRDLDEKAASELKLGIEKEEDFFTLMECLGLAAWQGGGRTGTQADFERVRDKIYARERASVFKGLEGAELRNVAVQFFAHRGNDDEPGYAFIHKSFGEYLTARALINAGEKWLQRYQGVPEDFAKAWLQLTGEQWLSEDVLAFMINEIRLRVAPSDAGGPDPQERVEQFCEMARAVTRDGFPAHGAMEGIQAPATWRGRERLQRNAETALYIMIHAWAEVGFPFENLQEEGDEGGWRPGKVKIFDDHTVRADDLLRRISDQRPYLTLIYRIMSRLDFSKQVLSGCDFRQMDFRGACFRQTELADANLRGADLRRADLRRADLREADLRRAVLIEADLRRAVLIGADLREAVLREADLIEADLIEADLIEADLIEADLRGADLREADLRGADLGGAVLRGADLRGAVLIEADLREAVLREAVLRGADCSRLNIDSARLQSADCSGAVNLTQEQIDKAFGNSATKLPPGTTRPDHWDEV